MELESSSLDAVFTYLREEGCHTVEDVESQKDAEAEAFAEEMRTAGAFPNGTDCNGVQRWFVITQDSSGKKTHRTVESVQDVENLRNSIPDDEPEEAEH